MDAAIVAVAERFGVTTIATIVISPWCGPSTVKHSSWFPRPSRPSGGTACSVNRFGDSASKRFTLIGEFRELSQRRGVDSDYVTRLNIVGPTLDQCGLLVTCGF